MKLCSDDDRRLQPMKKLSVCRVVVNCIKSSVGVGVYAMPYMLTCASPTLGLALLIAVVMTSCFCVEQLVACRHALEIHDHRGSNAKQVDSANVHLFEVLNSDDNDSYQVSSEQSLSNNTSSSLNMQKHAHGNSYAALAFRALGCGGRWFAMSTLWLAMYGSLISYLIFFKQNLPALVPALEPVKIWIPCLCFPLLVAFLLFRDMRLLFYVNTASLLFLVAASILICINAWPHFTLTTTLLLLNWADPSAPSNTGVTRITLKSVAVAFGICAFAMEGLIALAMENYDSLARPRRTFPIALWTGMVIFSLLYAIFSVVSCYSFISQPGGVKGSILENFPHGNLFWQIVGLFCVGQVFLTYPLVFVVPRQIIEEEFPQVFGDASRKVRVKT